MEKVRTVAITAHQSEHGDIKLQLTPLFNDIFGFRYELNFTATKDEYIPASYELSGFVAAEADLFAEFLPSYCPLFAARNVPV